MKFNKVNFNCVSFCLLAIFWSGSFIAIKITNLSFPSTFSAMLRVAVSLFFLVVIFRCSNQSTYLPFPIRWKVWLIGLAALGFPFFCLFRGEQYISAGLAGILNGTTPLWAFLFSLFFLKTKESRPFLKIVGVFLSLLGTTMIFWPALTPHRDPHYFLGITYLLLMAMSYSTAAVLNQHFLTRNQNKISFQAALYHQHCAGLVFLVILSVSLDTWPSWQAFSHAYSALAATFYMGLFSTALGWILFYRLIREWDAVRASSAMYLVPLLTLAWDFIFFKTLPHFFEALAAVVILAGVILIQASKKSSHRNLQQQPCDL